MDGGPERNSPFSPSEDIGDSFEHKDSVEETSTATEALALNPRNGRGVFTSPPYGEGYVLSDRATGENEFSRESYVDTAEKAFTFSGEKLMLDVRKMGEEKRQVIDYLEAEKKVIITGEPDVELLVKAVENGFEAVACEKRCLDKMEDRLERAERKFMLEKLRELDSN
jgi:hypothetical protein